MKTMRCATVVCALALLVAGCATTFRPWNLSNIQEGMPREEVVKVLGNPDFSETKDGAEYLHYTYREDFYPDMDSSAKVYGDDMNRAYSDLEKENAFREYEYVVILVDGQVINYKEL